jgi:hypothetical protein
LSDARSKSFSFASVATATQIILATLPLYSQNATWRSSTANTDISMVISCTHYIFISNKGGYMYKSYLYHDYAYSIITTVVNSNLSRLNTTLCDKVCKWFVASQWFSLGTLVSSTNKTDCHDISKILLKVEIKTIPPPIKLHVSWYLIHIEQTVRSSHGMTWMGKRDNI